MRLYQFVFDGDVQWVEAPTLAKAMVLWHDAMKETYDDWERTEEPDSINVAGLDPVIRGAA